MTATRLGALLASAAAMLADTAANADTFEEARVCRTLRCAISAFKEGAAAGDARCMLGLGIVLERGVGGDAKPLEALALYEQAAEAGLEEAALNAGVIHATGNGVKQDYATAAKWFARHEELGRKRALERRSVLEMEPITFDPPMRRYFQSYPRSLKLAEPGHPLPRQLAEDSEIRAYLIASYAIFQRLLTYPRGGLRHESSRAKATVLVRPSDMTVRAGNYDGEPFVIETVTVARRAFAFAPMPPRLRAWDGDIPIDVVFVLQ